MNLTTPDKIRNLQRKLYCKAKAEPTFRFYLLYDKICREDILIHAYRLARIKCGSTGCGWDDVCSHRGAGPGSMVGGLARGTGLEDVPT